MEGNLHFIIDWASLILGSKFTVFLCFTLCLRATSKYKPRGGGGGSIWRSDLTEGLMHYEFGGLVFGGPYTWRGLFSEFYGILVSFSCSFKRKYPVCWILLYMCLYM